MKKIELSDELHTLLIKYWKQSAEHKRVPTLDGAIEELLRNDMMIFSLGESSGLDLALEAIKKK